MMFYIKINQAITMHNLTAVPLRVIDIGPVYILDHPDFSALRLCTD